MAMTRAARVAIVVPAAFVLLLGLAACGDESDSASGGAGGGVGGGAEEPTGGPDGPDSDADGDGDDTVAGPASPSECLIGSWLLDNEHFGGLLASAALGTGGAISTPTGTVTVDFAADDTYRVSYAAWTIRASAEGGTFVLVRDGVDAGEYQAADDGTLHQRDTAIGSTATVTFAGGGTMTKDGEPTSTTSAFSCEADTLSVTSEGETSILYRQ